MTDRFHSQFQAIAGIAAGLVAESDPSRVFDGILTGATRLLGADACALFVSRASDAPIRRVASYGLTSEYLAAVTAVGESSPVIRRLRDDLEALIILDAEAEAGPMRDALRSEGIRTMVAAPLLYEGRLLGTLVCYYRSRRRLTASDQTLMWLFATLAAAATENCRIHDESKRRAERLRVLSEIGVAVSQVLNLEDLYLTLFRQASRVLQVDAFYVATYQPERQSIVFHLTMDHGEPVHANSEYPLGSGPSSWAIVNRRPFVLNDDNASIQSAAHSLGSETCSRSAMHVPMMLGDAVIGVISAQSYQPDAYSDEDLELLQVMATQTAVAISNAKLFAEQTKASAENRRLNAIGDLHAERLRVLNEIGLALSGTLDLDALYETVFQQTSRVLKADAFYIALWNPDAAAFSFPFQIDDGAREVTPDAALGVGPTSRVLRTRQSVVVNNLDSTLEIGGRLFGNQRDSAAAMHVPMILGDEVIGVMSAQSYQPEAYNDEDLRMLETVAAQTAVAIGNARLFAATKEALDENRRLHTESRQRAERLKVLNETGLALTRALHRDDLYERIYQQASRVLAVDSFYVALWNPDRRTISYSMFERDRVSDSKIEAPLSDGPSSWVIRNKRPYIVSSGDDPLHVTGFSYGDGPEIRSALHVPLMMGDRILGAMSTQSYQPAAYTDEDLQVFETLAGQTAVALENARLYEAVRDASLTDELTGLPNRRAITNRLHEELSRAARYGYSVCVLLLDLDFFKKVNDTHGHSAGDTVLRELSILLRGSLRAHDGLGRWGGEEFVAVLVHTDKMGGEVVAENLRRAVENHPFQAGSATIAMSTSIGGVALDAPNTAEANRLLDVVDACLYRAKAAGRNQVVFWSGSPDAFLGEEG
ncbi:MAG TPA: GAF domain-containing protein [Armatimonadota bacterium]